MLIFGVGKVGLFDKRLWVKVERRWGLGRATSLKFTTREEKNKEDTRLLALGCAMWYFPPPLFVFA
jgi:hypothetical protein